MDLEEALKISGKHSTLDAFEFFIQKGISSFFITNGPEDVTVYTDGRIFEKYGRNKFHVSRLVTEEIRKKADIPTGAVGIIVKPQQAEEIISSGSADAVLLARQMLRDPYWPLRVASELGAEMPPPFQYQRAW
jgi:2,4-dienoyl-CoA reductase-like NADH-dependent reductase (Old Yellow Enzyme family)